MRKKIEINESKLFKLMEDLNPGYDKSQYTPFEKISPEDQALFNQIFGVELNYTGMKRGWDDWQNVLSFKYHWGFSGGRYWKGEEKKKIELQAEEFNQKSKNFRVKLMDFSDEEGDGQGHVDIPYGFFFTFVPKTMVSV